MRLFHDRLEAAHELARHLAFLKSEHPIVLGLANGGVPLAEVIAQALDAPLDVLLIERLTAPKSPDHVVGAVDEHGRISMIKSTARWHHLTSREMIAPAREVFRKLQRERGRIRSLLPELDVSGRTVIIVGQGVATGAKMLGAVASVRDRGAQKVVATAPAGSGEAAWQLHESADLVVIPHRPAKFRDVEHLYQEYAPVTDEMVLGIVERWVKLRPPVQRGVKTLLNKLTNDLGHLLCCEIDLPPGATRGSGPYPAVFFVHDFDGDGREPMAVATSRRLAKRGVMGARPDLTGHGRSEGAREEATDERMLEDLRLVLANLATLNEVDRSRLGLVGSGSGSALALRLAHERPDIRAVVARGPMSGNVLDLARAVKAPTLLVYAEGDKAFVANAARARDTLPSTHQLFEIPSATRVFNDAISLEMMVGATVDWMADHLHAVPVPQQG